MKTNVEEINAVKKKLEIEIEAAEIKKKVNEAYKQIGKKAKIPGFRPGKIPQNVLRSYYSSQVTDDVTRNVINESLPMAMEETNIMPLNMPVIENGILKEGEDFKYSAMVEVKPEFELKDYLGLATQKEILAVNDEEVDKQLEEIRRNQGTLKSVENGKKIGDDDYVLIDYEGFENEELIRLFNSFSTCSWGITFSISSMKTDTRIGSDFLTL